MKVYFDASPRQSEIGIGIYCETTNESHTIIFPVTTREAHMAEFLAFREAKRLYPEATMYYTDNQGIANKLKGQETILWVPRKQNTIADKLSKVNSSRPALYSGALKEIARHIASYSIDARINLWRRLAINKYDKAFVKAISINTEVPEQLHKCITPALLAFILSTHTRQDALNITIKHTLYASNNGCYKILPDDEIVKILSVLKG